MSPAPAPVTGWAAFRRMLWEENPVLVQILGICSTLAVTNLVKNTLVMCLGLVFVTACSSATVAWLRAATPRRVRMMAQVLIIATWTIVVKLILDAFFPDISRELGPYVGLIITNCIVMGRAEAYAAANKPWDSFLDGAGAGVGYAIVLLGIASFREPLGLGTWFGLPVMPAGFTRWNIMVIAPSGFFCLASVIWVSRSRQLAAAAAAASNAAARATPLPAAAPTPGSITGASAVKG